MEIVKRIGIVIWLVLSGILVSCENNDIDITLYPEASNSTEELSFEYGTKDTVPNTIENQEKSTFLQETEKKPESTENSSAYEKLTEDQTGLEDDGTPHIVWAHTVFFGNGTDPRDEIQRFLAEKGLKCHIDFVNTGLADGKMLEDWLETQKMNNSVPDIMSSGAWEYGSFQAIPFVEREFQILDSFFSTEEGKSLANNYSEAELAGLRINDHIYVIPDRSLDRSLDNAIYLYINDQYREYFEDFTCTYDSLKEMYKSISNDNLRIIMDGHSLQSLLALMGGYGELFHASYDPKSRNVVDLKETESFKQFLETVYSDYKNGILIDVKDHTSDIFTSETLAYLSRGKIDSPNGFSEILLTPDMQITGTGFRYGVMASSNNKELAFQVLALCYSDPEIASLICWGQKDVKRWQDITDHRNSLDMSEITGFVPRLSEEEVGLLFAYGNKLDDLSMALFYYDGKNEFNPYYLNKVKQFFSDSMDYGSVLEKINSQLNEWFESKEH
ncbi:MAG: hypothetical protein IK125_09965 [Lachnospiraceae bacterium]|nr:hypothetical protein [Lachnospiraceae bacterium]